MSTYTGVDVEGLRSFSSVLESQATRLDGAHDLARTALGLADLTSPVLYRLTERADHLRSVAAELRARADQIEGLPLVLPPEYAALEAKSLLEKGLDSVRTVDEVEADIDNWSGTDNDPKLDQLIAELNDLRNAEAEALVFANEQLEITFKAVNAELMADDLASGDALHPDWDEWPYEQQADFWMRTRLATFAHVPDAWGDWSMEERAQYFTDQGDAVLAGPPCQSILPHYLGGREAVFLCEHPTFERNLKLGLWSVAIVSASVATFGAASALAPAAGIGGTFGGGTTLLAGGNGAAYVATTSGVTLVISNTVLAGGAASVVAGTGIFFTNHIVGAGGQQTSSRTIAEQGSNPTPKNRKSWRVDVENPRPGQGPGNMHVHYRGEKYHYNFETGRFEGAPRKLQEILREPANWKKIKDGVQRYLGEGLK